MSLFRLSSTKISKDTSDVVKILIGMTHHNSQVHSFWQSKLVKYAIRLADRVRILCQLTHVEYTTDFGSILYATVSMLLFWIDIMTQSNRLQRWMEIRHHLICFSVRSSNIRLSLGLDSEHKSPVWVTLPGGRLLIDISHSEWVTGRLFSLCI
jgi:hypothetical protein